MVPAGLTLAASYGSPIHGVALAAVWVLSLAWLWLVWEVHWRHGAPVGRLYWRIDFAVRFVVMAAFVGFGAWCLLTRSPISSAWLAAKMLIFGLIILCGIVVRILLLRPPRTPSAGTPALIRQVVLVIWALVATAAFLGVTKPF
jgi:hypothetical protein